MPTKNGEIIAASAVVPAARPICSPEKCSVWPSHVPIVTYQAPQTKYCRNIIADSFTRTLEVMEARYVHHAWTGGSVRITRDSRSTAARSPSSTDASASSCSMLIT